MKLLVMNILPCFNTLLHFAYKRLSVIRLVYKIASKERAREKKKAEKLGLVYDPINGFLVPFIRNYDRKSPLHLCVENGNFKSADTFLENLKNEGIDNHSRAIYDALPACIEADIPAVGPYLDARFVQTSQIEEVKRGSLNLKNEMIYAVTDSELWPDKKVIDESLLKSSPLDSEIVIEFLDVPAMHCY
jgi:ankyrin repeat protein